MKAQSNKTRSNGVNGNVKSSSRLTPGGRIFPQQGTSDRHPVTACNTRTKLKIATWNVRTMHQAGKLENISQEATRLKVDIMGLAEVRWLDSGKLVSGDHTLIYSGGSKSHRNGVGIMLNRNTAKSIMGYNAISDRVLLVNLQCKPFNLSIIQVYAPTSSSSDEDIDDFYSDLNCAYRQAGTQNMIVVMGDLNAKVGNEQDPLKEVVGPHGLGERNERGDLWVEWCSANDQVIMNTWFKHHNRHLYTWKSPGDGVRNQIDYITINRRFRNSVMQVKGFPGADCGSDHIPIVSTIRVKLRQLKRKTNQSKLQVELLRTDQEYKMQYHKQVCKRLSGIDEKDEIGDRYAHFTTALTEAAKDVLPTSDPVSKQKWMTKEILQKMDDRRKAKGNNILYSKLDKEIKRECTEAKEAMLSEQCSLIEQLDAENKTNLMHAEIRKATGKKRRASPTTCIEAKDGAIIMEQKEILARWYEYIRELYEDGSRGDMPHNDGIHGAPITQREVEVALDRLPMKKSPGPDDITAEMLVAAGENGLTELTKMTNMIYDIGCFPEELNKSIFITIPKVAGTAKCEKHRTISLMSHVTKLVLQVIMNRIRSKTIQEVATEQYGFMPDKGTRNAIFVLRRLVERSIEKQKDVYACFIDYSKAFDTVKHEPLVELLHNLDIDDKDTRLLTNLYWKQQAAVRHNGEISDWMQIEQGVRQGCVASPHLFALYTEMIMRNIDGMDGFRVGGTVVNNLRYADDTVILAESQLQLQSLINVVVEESEMKGLKLNISKSFTMVFSKSQIIPGCKIDVHGKSLEQVKSFIYLGAMFTSDGKCDKEIRRRIGIAKSAFKAMENVLTSRTISLKVRLRVLKCYIWSTLLYGCETWTISSVMLKKLEATEVWFLRRMLRISWTAKITNVEVHRRTGTNKVLIKDIVRRQMSFLGHVIRKDDLENLVVTGYIDGRRDRGRQRETFMTYLEKMTNRTPVELIRLTRDRAIWSDLCKS